MFPLGRAQAVDARAELAGQLTEAAHRAEAAEQRAEQFAELAGARQDTIEALRAKLTSEEPDEPHP